MEKRILGIGLTLLTISLWVGPIAAAFGTHNWSVKETIMPSEEQINNIEDRMEELTGDKDVSSNDFSITESRISGGNVRLEVEFSSPFPFSLKIVKFQTKLIDEVKSQTIADIEMVEDSVSVDSEGLVTIEFEGSLTTGAGGYKEIPEQISLSGGVFKFIASGITVEVSIEDSTDSGGV